MRARDFCYWVQGFFEIDGNENCPLTAEQVGKIRSHLSMVFKHEIDPSFGDKTVQEALHKIHQGGMMGTGSSTSTPWDPTVNLLNC